MTDTLRANFEAFCKTTNPAYKSSDDGVSNRRDWAIWQAATMKATQVEPLEHVATVATTAMRVDIGWLKTVPNNTKLFAALLLPPTGTEQS